MNQILLTEKNNKQKNSSFIDMKKLIIIFSVILAILIIAIVLAKCNIFGKIKNIFDKESLIEFEQIENERYKISIKNNNGLKEILYWWNSETNVEKKQMNGEKEFNEEIDIPENYDTIHLKVESKNGKVNELEKKFTFKPEISLFYDGNSKININVKSRSGIQEVQYNWENEEATIVECNGEKEKNVVIDAGRGDNRLYINAIGIDGEKVTKEQSVIGVLAPEIEFSIEDGNILLIRIKHDKGFKKIYAKVNEQELLYDENYPGYDAELTDATVQFELSQGKSDIDVKVYTLEQPEKEYREQRYAEIP